MKKQYGLFKAIGEATSYANIGGTPLVKMHILSCDTLEELQEIIDNDKNIPSSTDYIIIEYWEYFKPIPMA